jgi:predicted TIM-barrel fold metal-dependent hydrolase
MEQDGIIDPHFHLWQPSRNPYPWLTTKPPPIRVAGDPAPIAGDYLVADYLAETAGQGVVKAVHVDAGWDYADPVAETRWLQAIANDPASRGIPQGIVARASLDAPDAEAVLTAHARHPNLRGIRQIANWHADPNKTYVGRPDLLSDPAFRRGFALLGGFGLSFDLQCYPSQFDQALRLADDFPATSIVLNHAGMPVDRDAEGLRLWRDGIRALARRPNVTVKISGLGMLDWSWTIQSIRPFVRDCLDAFGPDRAMFASNFPVDRLYSSYDRLYDAFRETVSDLPAPERRALFHDTALRIYRL